MADSPVDGGKVRKIAITNNDQGPRYVFTSRGQEVILAGQTLTTMASDPQVDAIEVQVIAETDDAPMFTVERTSDDLDDGGDQGKALTGLPVAKLRQIAAAEGVQLTGLVDGDGKPLPDINKGADIAAAIQAHRDANPAS